MKPVQSGATLVEVLVALLVFSFGLLGTVAMQARAARVSVDSEDRMRAAMLANELVSMMWAQRTAALSSADLSKWNERVADVTTAGLPGGAGTVGTGSVGGLATVTITITWTSPSHGSARYVTQLAM